MKKTIAALAILFTVSAAHAQSVASNGTGQASALSGGGTSSLNFAPVSGSSTVDYKVSSAIAGPLVAGFNTCLGSNVAALQTGPVGLSIGGTQKDDPCNLRSDAGQLYQMNLKAVAAARLCMNDDNRYAVAVSGGLPYTRPDGETVRRACPMTRQEWEAAGRPLLDPITGQPPVDPPVAAVPARVDPNVAIIEKKAAALAVATN